MKARFYLGREHTDRDDEMRRTYIQTVRQADKGRNDDVIAFAQS